MPSPSDTQPLKIKTLTPDSFEDGHIKRPQTAAPLPERTTGRKRRRTVLSCLRCHRSKVSCDRQKPCSRCKQTGRGDSCQYESNSPPETSPVAGTSASYTNAPSEEESEPIDTGRPDSIFIYRKGRVRHGGRSHYALLLREFANIQPATDMSDGLGLQYEQRLKSLKKLYPPKRFHNYPFGQSSASAFRSARQSLLDLLPEPPIARRHLLAYFRTFNLVYPVEHELSFLAAYERFVDGAEAVPDDWLAQLFIMLALGMFAAECNVSRTGAGGERLETLLHGAEEALQRTPFMLNPTLNTVRALTLIAVAKFLDLVSYDDSDTLWNYMGFVQRTAMCLSLHRDPEPLEDMKTFEKEMRRRVWASIVFLDLQVSSEHGMPTLLRPQDYSTRKPSNVEMEGLTEDMTDDQLYYGDRRCTSSMFHMKIGEILPDICAIISNINSTAPDLKYKDVLDFDARLRQTLRENLACVSKRRPLSVGPTSFEGHDVQAAMLQVFIRGVMLALHRHYFMDPEKHPAYQTSYWTVLECSLAILGQQQQVCDATTPGLPSAWFNDLNQGSYYIAAAHVALGIKEGSFLKAPMAAMGSSANETAWSLMTSMINHFRNDVGRSIEHFKRYSGFYQQYAILQAYLHREDTELARRAAVDHIVQVVTEKMGALYPDSSKGLR